MCTGTRDSNRKFEDSPPLPIVDYKALNMHKNNTDWTVKFVIKLVLLPLFCAQHHGAPARERD